MNIKQPELFAEMCLEFSDGAGSCLKLGTGDAKCCSSYLVVGVLSQGCGYVGFPPEILVLDLFMCSELHRAQFKQCELQHLGFSFCQT